jgi:hypothetical protein
LVVLFGHHAINSLTNNEPDESAPPCTGVDDGHGHDQNPGCDLDPRLSTHSFPSCRPPVQASAVATVGTPDANGKAANSVGYVVYNVAGGDVRASVSVSDVRRADTLADYSGALQARATARATDRYNGSAGSSYSDAATVSDFAFPVDAPCTGTSDLSVGAACKVGTTLDAVVPGAVRAGGPNDLGARHDRGLRRRPGDGDPGTADNTLFAAQGLFVP